MPSSSTGNIWGHLCGDSIPLTSLEQFWKWTSQVEIKQIGLDLTISV